MSDIHQIQEVTQPMTISDYCKKRKVNQRYLRRIVTADKKQLLNDSYGVVSYQIFGKTYILNVRIGFENISKNEVAEPKNIKLESKITTQIQLEIIDKPAVKGKEKNKNKLKSDSKLVSKSDTQKKSPIIVSLADAKNMVANGVATCTTEIIGEDGIKKVKAFKTVNEAIKTRKNTNSNSRIWIWNNETNDLLYLVDDKGNVY